LVSWAGQEPALLVGDMNSEPGSAEMDTLLDEGFRDAWEVGAGPGFTSPAIAPDQRIDWVFHTPDLAVTAAEVLASQASDHFPVAVSIRTCGADC
jgi:endonuclease/exonuclease/phosphatase family metal-dependent hydrolase